MQDKSSPRKLYTYFPPDERTVAKRRSSSPLRPSALSVISPPPTPQPPACRDRRGPRRCAPGAAELMEGGRSIVNLHSPGAERYLPKYAPVAISKGALASLTTYLAVELAPRGVRVNGVSAGLVDGSDGVRMLADDLLERYRQVTPAGRLVTPGEVANAVAYLCGEEASMIVGQVLLVDGGYSLVGLV